MQFNSAGINTQIRHFEERSMSMSANGGNASACAFIEITQAAIAGSAEVYGVGMDANIVTASIKALVSGINRIGAV